MNFSPNRDTSLLNADEASAIETAVRTAVMSILKVFCDVNEKKSHCYEAKLAEAERENAALKFQLKAAEQELQTLRQISSSSANYTISAEVTLSHDFSTDVTEERGEEAASFQSDGSVVIKEEPSHNTLCLKSEMADETFATECDYPGMDNVQICQQTPGAEMWSMQHVQSFSSARSSLNQTREKGLPAASMESKNGRPSQHSEEEQPEKRPKTSVGPRPSRLCRFDQTGHWPVWVERKGRCKYPGCTGIVKVQCSKCATYLCFSVERNCFVNFHKQ
ncbi:uncharacterized protein LOC128599930 isoform X2 [Ictalurus furcatus]|uniref:uncharacterized protein LOC128599930 isoform X2 n=1 Tax=Ictalurus furcatus TaxID=66913 RepID=UPI00234FCADC|nr:uncharacterized protein LOC128599930 isoform X2 [Ictalurus furcatus]